MHEEFRLKYEKTMFKRTKCFTIKNVNQDTGLGSVGGNAVIMSRLIWRGEPKTERGGKGAMLLCGGKGGDD